LVPDASDTTDAVLSDNYLGHCVSKTGEFNMVAL